MCSKDQVKALKYLQLARFNAVLFSKDPDTKVGAIALDDTFSRVLSMGINGMPRKLNDENKERWTRPTKYKWVVHSEQNMIANAARTGTPLDGAVMVVTKYPCSTCTKSIIQAGIKKIYTITPDYSDPVWGDDARVSEEMLEEAGVVVIKYDMKAMNIS